MPIYEFQCETCGREVEVFQQGFDKEAPECCEKPMSKKFSVWGMLKFKGEGGYPSRRKEFGDRKALMSRKKVPYLSNESNKIPADWQNK